ncbi:MAG: hypothetical protein JW821_02240 [Deltaproteobacteria bacterium]|nr:hypothetical protein [Deltaproteobacteria bacterium]
MIEGMKLSNELFLVRRESSTGSGPDRFRLFEKVTEGRINILFLTCSSAGKRVRTSFCVGAEDRYRMEDLILSALDPADRVEFVSSVGALSLFPHRFSLKILGLAAHAFGRARLPLYAMTSSISSLTFITDYDKLNGAAALMEETLGFPPGHTPYRPTLRVKQIP